MRRVFRIFVNALMILSLVLCLALAVLWVRSYRGGEFLRWHRRPGPDGRGAYAFAASGRGGASVGVGRLSPEALRGRWWEGWVGGRFGPEQTTYASSAAPMRWGFGRGTVPTSAGPVRVLVFPLWLPTALFAALPLAKGALFIRRRRRKLEGHCAKCGYDLRATPDRCPECGHVPAGAHRAASA